MGSTCSPPGSRGCGAGRSACGSARSPTWSASPWCWGSCSSPCATTRCGSSSSSLILRILALDSSSPLLSCALWEDGRVVAESLQVEKAGDVLPAALLALAPIESVDALAAGIGPGSFTGLRVGLAAVKALGYARKLPVRGASSLRALALAARRPAELLVPTLEARRGELYACAVRGTELVLPETVLRAQDLAAWLPEGAVVLGPGARANGIRVPDEPRAPAAWAVA